MLNQPFSRESQVLTIAIVGGGFSGCLVATHLLKNASQPLLIKLIERHSAIGLGIAYKTQEKTDLVNVPAGKMSAFPDDSDHLFRWLESNSDRLKDRLPEPLSATTFIPRQVYGLYLQSILADAQVNCPHHVDLEILNDEVIAIEKTETERLIVLKNSPSFKVDKVILAIGNSPVQEENQTDQSIYFAWSGSVLNHLKSNDDILLVGTGLTMVDMVIALSDRQHQGKIYALSRRGLSPQSHAKVAPYPPFLTVDHIPKTAKGLMQWIRQEVKKAENQGYNWRAVIDALRPITQQLWQELSLPEKARFLRHLTPYWDIHRHRIAPKIAEIIAEKLQSGQLNLQAGRIKKYQSKGNKIAVTFRYRSQPDDQVILVDRVIHCTGIPTHYEQSPLLNHLHHQGLISFSPLGLGIETDDQGRILTAHGEKSSLLYTIGTPRRGTLWETTAISELRQQAQTLAKTILADLNQQNN